VKAQSLIAQLNRVINKGPSIDLSNNVGTNISPPAAVNQENNNTC